MKKTILTLVIGLIGLSSFIKPAVSYEQIAFDYFISQILVTDFKNLSTIEFSGKTESTYSTLGTYKFCLKPEEKMQSLMEGVTSGLAGIPKDIRNSQIKNVTITNVKENSKTAKLYIYHSVRVIDNFYVFLTLHQTKDHVSKYVVELNVDGEVLRNCRMR
jgi:hypothetical protein